DLPKDWKGRVIDYGSHPGAGLIAIREFWPGCHLVGVSTVPDFDKASGQPFCYKYRERYDDTNFQAVECDLVNYKPEGEFPVVMADAMAGVECGFRDRDVPDRAEDRRWRPQSREEPPGRRSPSMRDSSPGSVMRGREQWGYESGGSISDDSSDFYDGYSDASSVYFERRWRPPTIHI
ncbi:hypothetical protein FOZ62_015033, partial [Perkinsus olseni]